MKFATLLCLAAIAFITTGSFSACDERPGRPANHSRLKEFVPDRDSGVDVARRGEPGDKGPAPAVAPEKDAGPLCPDSNEGTEKKTIDVGDPLHDSAKFYKRALNEGHTRIEALCIAANEIRRYKSVKRVEVAEKTLLITYQSGYQEFYLVK